MYLLVTPSFERAVKKLHPQQKSELDEAVRIKLTQAMNFDRQLQRCPNPISGQYRRLQAVP